MIAYNVTVKVELDIHDDWLAWMKEVHIPEVLETGMFKSHRMFRLLEQDEQDGITYSIQYFLPGMTDYFRYQEEFAPALQKAHTDRYSGKFVAFRTIMKVVD